MWEGVVLVDFQSGSVHLSAAAKLWCRQSVWSSKDMLSTCGPQLWSSSLPSGSSLWKGDFSFSCSRCTRVSDVLQKSLPVALQYFAGQTILLMQRNAWHLGAKHWGKIAVFRSSVDTSFDMLQVRCAARERTDIQGVFLLWAEVPTIPHLLICFALILFLSPTTDTGVLSCFQGSDYEQGNGVAQEHRCSLRYWLIGCIG